MEPRDKKPFSWRRGAPRLHQSWCGTVIAPIVVLHHHARNRGAHHQHRGRNRDAAQKWSQSWCWTKVVVAIDRAPKRPNRGCNSTGSCSFVRRLIVRHFGSISQSGAAWSTSRRLGRLGLLLLALLLERRAGRLGLGTCSCLTKAKSPN